MNFMIRTARQPFALLLALVVASGLLSAQASAAALPEFTEIVESKSPAVVKIIVEGTSQPALMTRTLFVM